MAHTGWKRSFAGRAAGVALAALLCVSAAAGVAKTETWTVTALKSPDSWEHVYPNAIDRQGRVVGWYDASTPAQVTRAVLWPDGASDPVELPLPAGGQNSAAISMNDRGQVVGNVDNHAVLWDRKGAITDLHARLTGFDVSSGISINRRGDVIGYGVTSATGSFNSILWPRRGAPVVLPIDESVYASSWVWQVNDRGTVCGNAYLQPSGIPGHAVYWPRGRDLVDLHAKVRDAMPTAEGSAALRVLSDGRIVGIALEPLAGMTLTREKPWVYDPRTDSVRMIDVAGADLAQAWASAGSGTLVGFLDGDPHVYNTGLGTTRPALWRKRKTRRGATWDLTVLPVPAGYAGMTLDGCNAKGVIIAQGNGPDGTVDAMVVTRSRR